VNLGRGVRSPPRRRRRSRGPPGPHARPAAGGRAAEVVPIAVARKPLVIANAVLRDRRPRVEITPAAA